MNEELSDEFILIFVIKPKSNYYNSKNMFFPKQILDAIPLTTSKDIFSKSKKIKKSLPPVSHPELDLQKLSSVFIPLLDTSSSAG